MKKTGCRAPNVRKCNRLSEQLTRRTKPTAAAEGAASLVPLGLRPERATRKPATVVTAKAGAIVDDLVRRKRVDFSNTRQSPYQKPLLQAGFQSREVVGLRGTKRQRTLNATIQANTEVCTGKENEANAQPRGLRISPSNPTRKKRKEKQPQSDLMYWNPVAAERFVGHDNILDRPTPFEPAMWTLHFAD